MDKNTDITLSPKGLEKLKNELAERTGEMRKKLADDIEENRNAGDVSENEGFEISLDNYASNEARIAEIEHIIATAIVVESKDDGKVGIGETVVVKNSQGVTITYEIVGDNEADPLNNKITDDSPIGSALVGHKKGDKVSVNLPAGKIEYEILEVKE
jgi:transcription elongation factor GreA